MTIHYGPARQSRRLLFDRARWCKAVTGHRCPRTGLQVQDWVAYDLADGEMYDVTRTTCGQTVGFDLPGRLHYSKWLRLNRLADAACRCREQFHGGGSGEDGEAWEGKQRPRVGVAKQSIFLRGISVGASIVDIKTSAIICFDDANDAYA
jgi:hypothetical protein